MAWSFVSSIAFALALTVASSAEAREPAGAATAARPLELRCGEDRFQVTFDRLEARVRQADGEQLVLARMPGTSNPRFVRTYTNGRLTFTRSNKGHLSFAPGRMAPQRCEIIKITSASAIATESHACRQERGLAAARLLVDQCLRVSPATHPPCNADNECALIQAEIRRGCDIIGSAAPGFCKAP